MKEITIRYYTREELRSRGVFDRWSMWVKIVRKNDCEVHHEASEEIYILKGSGCIVTKTGEVHYIRAGNHLTISSGVRLMWHISRAITYKSRCY